MKLFRKRIEVDERITQMKNKIYAEVYILIMIISSISAITKHFIYDLPIGQIATELIILLVSSIYYGYRSISLGVVSAEIEMQERKSKWSYRKKNVIIAITIGIGFSLFFGINSAVRYAAGIEQGIYYFLITTGVSLVIYLPFFILIIVIGNEFVRRKSERAEENLLIDGDSGDDDEKY